MEERFSYRGVPLCETCMQTYEELAALGQMTEVNP